MTSASSKLTVLSWALYDFASTIFSMNIITLYFVLWVTIDMHGEDILYSLALSGSMLLAAVIAPILGTISDKLGKKMPFLIALTLIAFVFTASIGLAHNLTIGLLAFAAANLCFQLCDVIYNALLPQVSGAQHTGRVSGYGKSFGYLGAIAGLLIAGPITLRYGRQAAFIPTAVLFVLFSLPCFFLVKDSVKVFRLTKKRRGANTITAAFIKLKHTLVNVRKYQHLTRAALAMFVALNTISTVFIFMSVYVEKVIGFTDADIQILYIVSSIAAIMGAFTTGFITDFLGAKRTTSWILIMWCVAIALAGITAHKLVFWFIGPLVGISLGGIWTSARALVAELSPPDMIGEVFGFYGLVGKMAAIIGPLVWGICVWALGFLGIMKYRITVGFLLSFLILGLVILRKVPNKVK